MKTQDNQAFHSKRPRAPLVRRAALALISLLAVYVLSFVSVIRPTYGVAGVVTKMPAREPRATVLPLRIYASKRPRLNSAVGTFYSPVVAAIRVFRPVQFVEDPQLYRLDDKTFLEDWICRIPGNR